MSELRTKYQETIAWAQEIGMSQIGASGLGPAFHHGAAALQGMSLTTSMDAVKRAADEYNHIAEASAKAGLQQLLHGEFFELSQVDGRLAYQVLLDLLDPNLVKMQFHMQMMPILGDPVMYFNRYPGRFLSMHLQGVDLNAPSPPRPDPGTPLEAIMKQWRTTPQLAVGRDSVDWVKLFAAAKTGGVKNYFVEQDWELTVQSVAYLKTLSI
jgi:sugar phosphate isomerase/epimerase